MCRHREQKALLISRVGAAFLGTGCASLHGQSHGGIARQSLHTRPQLCQQVVEYAENERQKGWRWNDVSVNTTSRASSDLDAAMRSVSGSAVMRRNANYSLPTGLIVSGIQ